VDDIPEGSWFCDPCAKQLKPTTLVCELCTHKGGAYKAVFGKNKWVHSLCYRWIAEVYTSTGNDGSVSVVLDRMDKKRFRLHCSLCEEKGACVQCAHGRCQIAAHPWCIQHKPSKCVYRMLEHEVDSGLWEMQMFCGLHAHTIPDGMTAISKPIVQSDKRSLSSEHGATSGSKTRLPAPPEPAKHLRAAIRTFLPVVSDNNSPKLSLPHPDAEMTYQDILT
jgi:hypothetical protein